MRSAQSARVTRSAPGARSWLLGLGLCWVAVACRLERAPSALYEEGTLEPNDGTGLSPQTDAVTPIVEGGAGGSPAAMDGDAAVDAGGAGDGDASTDAGPSTPDPNAERCDGQDNDGDGKIDEDLGQISCGVGACRASVVACKDGQTQKCKPKAAKDDEICNEIDDDCDGKTDESADDDDDGFSVCDGDCCDKAGACGAGVAALVNPGAFEVLGNGIDDDCDADTTDSVKTLCEPAALDTPTSPKALAQAMELCRFTTKKPKSSERTWGVISATLFAADHESTAPADVQRGVLAQYGPNVLPRLGATMAAISSGTARDESDPGFTSPEYPKSWAEGSVDGSPPAAYLAAHGGALSHDVDCPDSDANDSIALELHVRVPTNAHSFSLRFKLYSSEYSDWICHDYFLALVTTSAPGVAADRNIAINAGGQAIALDNSSFDICEPSGAACASATELVGTGMQLSSPATASAGAGTAWFTASAPVKPGEEMVLELIVWDTGDQRGDTIALIDAFEWSVDPVVAAGAHR